MVVKRGERSLFMRRQRKRGKGAVLLDTWSRKFCIGGSHDVGQVVG